MKLDKNHKILEFDKKGESNVQSNFYAASAKNLIYCRIYLKSQ